MFTFRNTHTLAARLAIGLGLILSANLASANIILNFNGTSLSSNSPATGASATAELSFSDVFGGVLIGFSFRNTTGVIAPFGLGATTSKLTGVAIDLVNPNTGTIAFNPGSFLDTLIPDADNQPFGTLDIGIADNSNFIGGNANDALAQGATDFSSLILGGTGLSAVNLQNAFFSGFTGGSLNYVARFQQVNGGSLTREGSDKLEGGTVTCDNCGSGGDPKGIPEPASLLLMSAGLIGFGFARRRRSA